jgi:hypothetical protein
MLRADASALAAQAAFRHSNRETNETHLRAYTFVPVEYPDAASHRCRIANPFASHRTTCRAPRMSNRSPNQLGIDVFKATS